MHKRLLLVIILFFSSTQFVSAFSLIRDTETESLMADLTSPIFYAANLDPKSIDIYIVNDNSINAFVAGGQNLFVNTGIITLNDDPNGLIGVIAHETGHITGGHLARMGEDIEFVQKGLALSYILGIAAAISGSVDAGQAIILGGSHAAERSFYGYTRQHEESADAAAMRYLTTTKTSGEGLLDFFQLINSKERELYDNIDPYTRTHPLTRERIGLLKDYIKKSPYSQAKTDTVIKKRFKRVAVKLEAFLGDYEDILAKYRGDNDMDIYARAIAYHRQGHVGKALIEINKLLAEQPKDPYLIELKGQIYYEGGKPQAAVKYYKKANELLDGAALVKVQLAAAMLSTKDQHYNRQAIKLLKEALIIEKTNGFAFRQLAIAYGNLGQIALSNLAIAEQAMLEENYVQAIRFAKLAQKELKETSPDSPELLRTVDIIKYALQKN
jgi:predicted Zn-dependent protease